jgi:hypothetical protein
VFRGHKHDRTLGLARQGGLNSFAVADDDDAVERVRSERDPIRRARLAGELINTYQQRAIELARLRKEAINAAAESGLSFSAVADRLGLTRGRISQIRRSAPAAERAFFGVGPVTYAFPLRHVPGRALPVISAEDDLARQRLAGLLTDLAFKIEPFPIPPDGKWEPPLGDVVAICGPVNSEVTAEALTSDPFLSFDRDMDSGLWTIRDRSSGERFISPMDLSAGVTDMAEIQWSDFSYVGRLAYKDRTLLIIAGIHALGSVGAVDFLASHLPELYAEVGTNRFSTVIRSDHDSESVTRSELACPPRVHP